MAVVSQIAAATVFAAAGRKRAQYVAPFPAHRSFVCWDVCRSLFEGQHFTSGSFYGRKTTLHVAIFMTSYFSHLKERTEFGFVSFNTSLSRYPSPCSAINSIAAIVLPVQLGTGTPEKSAVPDPIRFRKQFKEPSFASISRSSLIFPWIYPFPRYVNYT